MPTLKQLRCELEWGSTKTPFPEYGTTYGDGLVETYVAIPDHPQPFAIRLTSRGYIAEGLAMLIFMDGEYQCNRNRLNLKFPGPQTPRNMTEIDLRVRQKEKALGDGTYLGREWRFDKHNIVPVDQLPSNVDRQQFHKIGAICVLVLRCRAKEQAETRSSTSSDVDDSGLQPSEPLIEMSTEDHASSNTSNSEAAEIEAETLLGFMNDGTADHHRFGLDGEGPGPTEQKAWSWPAPQPSHPASQGQQGAYVPVQQPPAQTQLYGSYGQPQGLPQSGQPGPALGQGQPPAHRPQRHVHFNDQIPRQPSGSVVPDHRLAGQNLSTNTSQLNPSEYPQRPNIYSSAPQSDYTNPATSYGAAPQVYVHPSLFQAQMMPTTQDPGTGFFIGAEQGYAHPVPSYQPLGYGAPAYTGWPPAVQHPAYAQPTWPVQSMAGASYLTTPNLAPPIQPSYPYPYPQTQFPGGPLAPAPYQTSNHPGGGIWGPPPTNTGSQDPAKDENNQVDGPSNQNQHSTAHATSQSNDNNDQGWDNNANKTQAGESGWSNNDTGGGQNDNWDTTATHTEAPTTDWNQSTINDAQTNNVESTWNTTADTSTQVQDSWSAEPGLGQPNVETFSMPQHAPAATIPPAKHRPLYGPHGPYHQIVSTSTDGRPQPEAGEEPPYDVPEDMPTTHQVKPGEGYMYVHKRRSPEYLDTLEEPYARFIFKYRTKEQIGSETGIKIEDEPTGDEEKRKLQVMDKDEIIEMLLRAKNALGGNITSPAPSLSSIPKKNTSSVGMTAIPAPAYSFLDYSVPNARTNSHVPSSVVGNVGLGVSIPAPAATAAATTQDWAGNNNWGNASVVSANAAPAVVDLASQQQTAATWPAPAASAQPPPPSRQAQAPADTWSAPAPSAQDPPQAQAPAQPQGQPQAQNYAQQQQQPPIAPIQFNPTVQTYNPQSNRAAASAIPQQPAFAANGRPITPPDNRGWGGRSAASSSVGDNGMAGWDATGAAGGGGAGAGGGWGGEGAANQPSGTW